MMSLAGVFEDLPIKAVCDFIKIIMGSLMGISTHLFEGKIRMRGWSVHETLLYL